MDKAEELRKKLIEYVEDDSPVFNGMLDEYAQQVNREDESKATQLIKLLDEYIDFIGEELGELAVMASNRGWKSSRVKEGESKRNEILSIRNEWKSNQEDK